MEPWLSLGVGVIGIISTVVAWKLNPRRLMYAELDSIYKKLEKLYVKRDKALYENDTDSLTAAVDDIIKLLARSSTLLQRIK